MAYTLSTNIDFGNAGDLVIDESGSPVEVGFASEPRDGPEVMWFCFRLHRNSISGQAAADDRVRLIWRHYHNALGANDSAHSLPVLRYGDQDWRRLDPPEPIAFDDGRLWLTWEVPAPPVGGWLEAALCYPYGPENVDKLVGDTRGYWRVDTLGLSQHGRPLTRLSNGSGKPGNDQPGLFVIARQHAGETPGSWVVDGLLRALAELAAAGRKIPLTWCVPLADIDGIIEGAYGKDRFPYDLNRAWGRPSMRHEALVIQRDMVRWAARCRPILALDSHAPGLCEAAGVYAYMPDPDEAPRRTQLTQPWCDTLAAAIGQPLAAASFGRVAQYRSRWSTPSFTAYAGQTFDCAALALETPYSTVDEGRLPLTRERYQEIGRRIAIGVIERLSPL